MFGIGIFSAFINNMKALNEDVVAMRQFFAEGNRRLRGEAAEQIEAEDDDKPKAKKISAKAS